MKLQEKFIELRKNKNALLATNYYNFETLKGVLVAAKNYGCPLILQLTESSINYMGLENAVALGRSALSFYQVEGWIHLDHGGSIELVEQCLKAGFDSVMIDGSELPIEQNVEVTCKVVELAKAYDVNVEAELGYIAKLGQSSEKVAYTNPEDARSFVENTKVNALAVAIGTAHGFYKEAPKLDFDRLSEIEQVTDAALVLHGGSGVPVPDVRKSISLGICKVNLATEIKNIFMKTLQSTLANNSEIDLRIVFPAATEAVTKLVTGKMEMIYGINQKV
ncbi:MAG: class II fructose-bisphosphate aldolase [Bacteroidetes bacterium]|nr:MAG: class II fructose-bisphosphate aldolase [Bacteroidota bacterium]